MIKKMELIEESRVPFISENSVFLKEIRIIRASKHLPDFQIVLYSHPKI